MNEILWKNNSKFAFKYLNEQNYSKSLLYFEISYRYISDPIIQYSFKCAIIYLKSQLGLFLSAKEDINELMQLEKKDPILYRIQSILTAKQLSNSYFNSDNYSYEHLFYKLNIKNNSFKTFLEILTNISEEIQSNEDNFDLLEDKINIYKSIFDYSNSYLDFQIFNSISNSQFFSPFIDIRFIPTIQAEDRYTLFYITEKGIFKCSQDYLENLLIDILPLYDEDDKDSILLTARICFILGKTTESLHSYEKYIQLFNTLESFDIALYNTTLLLHGPDLSFCDNTKDNSPYFLLWFLAMVYKTLDYKFHEIPIDLFIPDNIQELWLTNSNYIQKTIPDKGMKFPTGFQNDQKVSKEDLFKISSTAYKYSNYFTQNPNRRIKTSYGLSFIHLSQMLKKNQLSLINSLSLIIHYLRTGLPLLPFFIRRHQNYEIYFHFYGLPTSLSSFTSHAITSLSLSNNIILAESPEDLFSKIKTNSKTEISKGLNYFISKNEYNKINCGISIEILENWSNIITNSKLVSIWCKIFNSLSKKSNQNYTLFLSFKFLYYWMRFAPISIQSDSIGLILFGSLIQANLGLIMIDFPNSEIIQVHAIISNDVEQFMNTLFQMGAKLEKKDLISDIPYLYEAIPSYSHSLIALAFVDHI